MSFSQPYKLPVPRVNMDKKKPSLNSNFSKIENSYAMIRKYRLTNNEHAVKVYQDPKSQESNSFKPSNNGGLNLKEHNPNKKPTGLQVRKEVGEVKKTYSGRFGEALARKDRFSFVDKENKRPNLEQPEGNASRETIRPIGMENIKSLVIEPKQSTKPILLEKEENCQNEEPEVRAEEDKDDVNIIEKKGTSKENKMKEDLKLAILKKEASEQCNKTIEEYLPSILEALKTKDNDSTPKCFLEKHKVDKYVRAKMVDWMIEIFYVYKAPEQVFFMAVNIMDLYFEKTNVVLEEKDVHLVGVTCIFMASKYEEIRPMQLSAICKNIAHGKLTSEQIKQKEMEILTTLNYKLTNPTPHDFLTSTLHQLDLEAKMRPNYYDYLQNVAIYLEKAAMYNYDIIYQHGYSLVTASVLLVTFQVLEKMEKDFPTSLLNRKVALILGVTIEEVLECGNKVLNLAKNFEKMYPELKTLKKSHPLKLKSNEN